MGHLRLADRAYAGIVQFINDEGAEVGDRLPSESRLAEMLRVSRTVVREALARLSSDGITEARRGAGSFVKRRPSDRLASYMPWAQMPTTMGSYEVRLVLEAEAARLAAARRSPEALATLEHALAQLRAALLSSAPAHEEDMQFHRAVAEATANEAFIAAFDALTPGVERIMKAGVAISRSRPPEFIDAMMREHEMIVDAIRAQDPDGAALAMRWHLSEGRKRLLP